MKRQPIITTTCDWCVVEKPDAIDMRDIARCQEPGCEGKPKLRQVSRHASYNALPLASDSPTTPRPHPSPHRLAYGLAALILLAILLLTTAHLMQLAGRYPKGE